MADKPSIVGRGVGLWSGIFLNGSIFRADSLSLAPNMFVHPEFLHWLGDTVTVTEGRNAVGACLNDWTILFLGSACARHQLQSFKWEWLTGNKY